MVKIVECRTKSSGWGEGMFQRGCISNAAGPKCGRSLSGPRIVLTGGTFLLGSVSKVRTSADAACFLEEQMLGMAGGVLCMCSSARMHAFWAQLF